MTLSLFLLVVALVLFVLAAIRVGGPIDLGWLGMAFVVAAILAEGRL
jgi:uncharacterized membrane protein YvlD (DUF360 family)